MVVAVAGSVWWFHEALAAALCAYALSGPMLAVFRRRMPPPGAEAANAAGR
jgi:hypothetical protein